jgi:hypothetical protein
MKLRAVWGSPVAKPYHKRPAFAGDPAILSLHSGKYDLPAISTYPGCGGRIGARRPARAIDRGERACRFEERLGEGYIRLVARLVRSITLHDRSLPLTFPLKPEKNREN